ncbi:unnamed protein product [Parnassius mnemosyne]|uniref:FLYWCH-type domain-containing protein n=1 Tax=Parnassius mnemosyne TaxID=213953 RepID=A0AAV1K9F9_9NEOP
MYEDYSFSYQGRKDVKKYLYCSRRLSTKCPARLHLDETGHIVKAHANHNHPPPKYTITKCGTYIKIA